MQTRQFLKIKKKWWGILIGAAIKWGVWTTRNKAMFEGQYACYKLAITKITLRAFKWMEADNLVLQGDFISWCIDL